MNTYRITDYVFEAEKLRGTQPCNTKSKHKKSNDHKGFEICFLVIIGNVSAFCYNENGLDGMCGCHSIWRRWGRYRERT